MLLSRLKHSFRFISPRWLAGPIMDKELRVMARRKRSYLVRFLYLVVMLLVVAVPWAQMMRGGSSNAAWRVSQMSQIGITLTLILTWMQFLSAQLLAVVFLSSAISDEIYHKTLGVLMTTPITGFQIVFGKLISRLLSLMILIGLSLPVLGLISLLGGVPWGYVISSFCITLTAALFAGTLSLFISIFQKRAYSVIVQTILAMIIWYLGVPVLLGWLSDWKFFMDSQLNQKFLIFLSFSNPYVGFALNQSSAMPVGFHVPMFWPWHCGIVLAESILILLLAAKIVRRVALAQIGGQVDRPILAGLWKFRKQSAFESESDVKLRTVTGQPVFWKETREPWLQGRRRIKTIITAIIAAAVLVASYGIGIKERYLDEDYTQVIYGIVLFLVGIIETILLSATMITTEREAQSWPILMATPLTAGQVLFGKAAGVVRKSIPAWFLLAAHLLIFTLVGYLHPAVSLHLFIIGAGIGLFTLGSGLFFSSMCRKTTTAVMANVGLAGGLWLGIPIFAGLTGEGDLIELVLAFHPIAHVSIALAGGGGEVHAARSFASLNYDWPPMAQVDWSGFMATTIVIAITSLVYACAGLGFYKMTKKTLRDNIFG
jgi:ABC-type transport system involved in multi-copper enzyme maturation permease subunit